MGGPSRHDSSAHRFALISAFAILYLVWGSTFLAIAFAVETFPLMFLVGGRYLLAGLVLLGWFYWRGVRPTARQWGMAVFTGALLFLGSNGLVTLSQREHVPSGRAALFISITPIWMGLVGWLFYDMPRPGLRMIAGMVAGFTGVALLIKSNASDATTMLGYFAIFAAPFFWVVGTYQTRHLHISDDSLLTGALQMVAGGSLTLLIGTVLGEWSQFAEKSVSTQSMLAFIYLAIFGSLLGVSAYIWLIRVASPTAVSTYTYVNPLVAVTLGWMFNGEIVDWSVFWASILILGAVVCVTMPGSVRMPSPKTEQELAPAVSISGVGSSDKE